MPRSNAAPRLCALVPQREQLDELQLQVKPTGLAVIWLPFADDIRRLELPPRVKPRPELKRAMKDIVRSIQLQDDLELSDPALQQHYANLQALALEDGCT